MIDVGRSIWIMLLQTVMVAATLLISGQVFAQQATSPAHNPKIGVFGASVVTLTDADAESRGLLFGGALVETVAKGWPADSAGVRAGDVIVKIDGARITDVAAFNKATLRPPQTKLKLGIVRGAGHLRLTVTLAFQPEPTKSVAVLPLIGAPRLMLDTGGHTSQIWELAFTSDGSYLVSASPDKTIRVWDWAAKTTVRTMRGHSDAGPAGSIYSMALSPDDRWLAVGGFLAGDRSNRHSIRLYDFASGQLAAVLRGHENSVFELVFSPDSKRLVSGSSDATAIIWDVAERKQLRRLVGHSRTIYGVDFTPDGKRVVTGSEDNTVRLWRAADGSLIAVMRGHTNDVDNVAVSPRDGLIASGDTNGMIRFWNGTTGAALGELSSKHPSIGSLAFSRDGSRLISTTGNKSPRVQIVWDIDWNGKDQPKASERVIYKAHNNTILSSAVSPDGNLIATGGGNDQEIHIWQSSGGKRIHTLAGAGASVWAARFSVDGTQIGWSQTYVRNNPVRGYGDPQQMLTLPLAGQKLGVPRPVGKTPFARSIVNHSGRSIRHARGGVYGYSDAALEIREGDRVIKSIVRDTTNGIRHNSYTFTPDGKQVISGGDHGAITAYDRDGNTLGSFIGHTSDIWAVAVSPDGRLLVSSSNDQTVRLWNRKTRELIVTLFPSKDGKDWVMWTPQGYYTGSTGAGRFVGWQLNRGLEHAADYVTAEQYGEALNRPDIITRAIELASSKAAIVEIAKADPEVKKGLTERFRLMPPEARIIGPSQAGHQTTGGYETVTVSLRFNGHPPTDPVFTVGDTVVKPRRVALPQGTRGSEPGEVLRAYRIPLEGKSNDVQINDVRISLTGRDGVRSTLQKVPWRLGHRGQGALDRRDRLHIVAIGVDKYESTKDVVNLSYAGRDARAFAKTARAAMAPLYRKGVTVDLLVNGAGGNNEPTRANILRALAKLKDVGETDTVALFIAGHGELINGRYKFLPTDVAQTRAKSQLTGTIDWENEIQTALTAAKGQRILFVDACRSGNAFNGRLLNQALAKNFVAYSATSTAQPAIEDPGLKHGLFTYALVKGLQGGALNNADGTTRVGPFGARVQEHVSELSRGSQIPTFHPGSSGRFVLVRQ